MLFGEYAVLGGEGCIVTAVDQRMTLTAIKTQEKIFHLDAEDVNIGEYKKPLSEIGKGEIYKGAQFVEIALKNIFAYSNKTQISCGLSIRTSSEFSSQFGLGSSSAVTVCTIKALSELFELSFSQKEIFDISYKTILDIQGKGSGFDIAAAIYGGTMYFVNGGKVVEPLAIKKLPLLIGYSGAKADTITLMNLVNEKFRNHPEELEKIYTAIEKIVERAKEALLSENWKEAGRYMNENQLLLKKLGVNTPQLEAMISTAIAKGAYGAKLSGAGGGDCMIALIPEKKRSVIRSGLEELGIKVLQIQSNAEGVRIE